MDPTALALLAAQAKGGGGVPSVPLDVSGRPATSDALARSDNQIGISAGNINFAAKKDVWVWALAGAALGALALVVVWPKAKG